MSTIKLPAASGGGSISIKGPSSSSSDVDLVDTSGNIKLSDDQKVKIGTGDDLQIQHTSGNSRITQSGAGNLIVEVTTTDSDLYLRAEDKVIIQPHNGNDGVICNAQGSTDLYHNNTKKLETTSTGVKVTTTLAATGNINPDADGGSNLGEASKRFYRGYFTHGIGLNGETAAGNMLDDYEEGTWLPTIQGDDSAGTTTYHGSDNRRGHYIKVGRKVTVWLTVGWGAATGTGDLEVHGLPFAIDTGTYTNPNGKVQAFAPAYTVNVTYPSSTNGYVMAYTWGGAGTKMIFAMSRDDDGVAMVKMTDGYNETDSKTKYIGTTLTYQVA
jgi:hypothetical protein